MTRRQRRTNLPKSAAQVAAARPAFQPEQALPPRLLMLAFFLSGMAGLIAQVVWAKALGLLFGYSAYAVSTVVAVFMAGLALGSGWLAPWTERRGNTIGAIRIYAWLEFGIAVSAAFSLAGLSFVRAAYLRIYPALHGSAALEWMLRFLGAALVLLLPAILMGATLPVLLRGVTPQAALLGARVGRFYAVNTLGAVAGTLLAGFALLPHLGLRASLACAVLLNLAAGVLALRSNVPRGQNVPAAFPAQDETPPAPSARTALLLLAFGITGASAIACEIAWTRLLATMLGSSVYAFSLVLAAFLAGIVIGSFLFERWHGPHRAVSLAGFGASQAVIAASMLAFLVLFPHFPQMIPPLLRVAGEGFGGLLFTQAIVAAAAILPAAIAFGFNFPLVIVLIAGPGARAGRISGPVGRAYAANTAGAIFAAVLTGFVLLPAVGAYRAVAVAAGLSAILALVLFLLAAPRRAAPALACVALLAAAAIAAGTSLFYDHALASYSTLLYASGQESPLTVSEQAHREDVVFLEDGVSATVSVSRSENYAALKINGKVDASTVDTSTQLLLGDLGAIFHPHPRRVLVIGFGGGMTASAVSRFPDVARIDCLEIEPAVIRAAAYLPQLARGVLQDARVHVVLDDARNFLQTTREPYDLIISEPSNPWIAGVSALYTTEFYDTVRSRLAPGGMFVQWVQAYGLDPSDFRMVLATLASHFANVTLWHSEDRDFLLLAGTDSAPLSFNRSRLLWRNTSLQEDFHALHLAQPESWPVYFRLSDREVRQFAQGAPPDTDNRTRLEYRAPRTLLDERLTGELASAIQSRQASPLPAELALGERPAALLASAASAVETSSPQTQPLLNALSALPGSATPAELSYLHGRALLNAGDASGAAEKLAEAEQGLSNRFQSIYWLAIAKQRSGAVADASALFSKIPPSDAHFLDALRSRVEMEAAVNQWRSAIALQQDLVARQTSPSARDLCRLGDLVLRGGRLAEAERPLRDGLASDPYAYLCHRDLGELLRATQRYAEAQSHLEFVLRFFPEQDPKVYLSLALLYRAEGKSERARGVLAKGRRIFPADTLLRQAGAQF